MPLMEAMAISQVRNIFIKPVNIKLFTGLVLDGFQYACLDNIPGNTEVLVYEPFKSKICSEWRIYIHNHKAIFFANYAGDIFDPPSPSYIRHIIDGNKGTFPIAYTIDIAVLQNGDFVVVEYNDMWAIGNYGIPNDMYVRMLKDRYFQIINQKS